MARYLEFLARVLFIVSLFALSGCAGYDGRGLQPGVATLPDVLAVMGEPAMRWRESDGRRQLAYPRGLLGTQIFMVFIGANGRLERIEGVLDSAHFARIVPGKNDRAAILKLLGPSSPRTMYFAARDELAWEWHYCDDWGQMAFFNVLFDATSGIVRSTLTVPDLSGPDSSAPLCGH